MKKIILTLIVLFIAFSSFSQTTNVEIPKQDTSLLYIADSLNSIGENIKEIGNLIREDYEELGFKGFIRVYKYLIITALVFIVLTLLWFKNRTGEEDEKK